MKIKKLVLALIIAILFSSLYAKVAMANTATVNTETLNLRKEPSTDSTVLELLNQGDKIEVLEEEGKWVKIKFKGITGYVSKDYIKITEDKTTDVTTSSEKENKIENTVSDSSTSTDEKTNTVKETENNINSNEQAVTTIGAQTETLSVTQLEGTVNTDTKIYILPIINASKIAEIKKDEKLTIIDEVKDWYYGQTENVSGWVRKVLVDTKEVEVKTSAVPQEQEAKNEQPKENEINNNEQTNTNEQENKTVNDKENTTSESTTSESAIQETPIKEKTMYVNYSSIYVRKGPGTNYEVVDSLILNSDVRVIAESGEWYKIKVSGITGYVAKRLLSNTITKEETTSRSADERETLVEAEDQANQINNVSSQGNNNTVVSTTATSKGQEIVNFAKQYLGCKYVYGGSGPSTFDCSGFTMYVYKHFGVSLSHSATAQSKKGSYVAKENLQPGDLVFFKDYQTMDGIGHCGIYIGDGNFIHASSGTGYCVKISTLLSGSYKTRYETARRLF